MINFKVKSEGETIKEIEKYIKEYGKENLRKELVYDFSNWKMGERKDSFDQYVRYLKDKIIIMLKTEKMNLKEVEVIIGYIRKLLNLDDDCRCGVNGDKIRIKYCLRPELICLSEEIANYIQTQKEVCVSVIATLDLVYEELKSETRKCHLW